MKYFLQFITDRVSTKKGMWITLMIWLVATVLLGGLAPSAKDYEVSSIASLPADAQSVIAQNKLDEYFEGTDVIPAILVFQSDTADIDPSDLLHTLDQIESAQIEGLEQLIPFSQLPPQVLQQFLSEDQSTAVIPLSFDSALEGRDLMERLDQIREMAEASTGLKLYVTGPAGVAADAIDLFSRADVVLILSTVGLILVLLVIIYRSPLLALIPLLAAAFVYEVVFQTLGLMGKAGLLLNNQSLSIMTILLFAAVIDYSLFVFSRYREELTRHEDKFEAMKLAMRETGMPVFFAGGTVLVAMLLLFFAQYGEYRNFAPIFGTAVFVIMLASITLVPALFTLFGRKSFWPKIPKVGEEVLKAGSFWKRIAKMVVAKPIASVLVIGLFLIVSALNVFNITYEFDTIKSFPSDMSSREGYEILEEKFAKGDLAQTTVLLESPGPISVEDQEKLINILQAQPLVSSVRQSGVSENERAVKYTLTFTENPYSREVMDVLESFLEEGEQWLEANAIEGSLYFAGETASKVDDRSVNNRDLMVIIAIEIIFILALLIFLTKSIKMPIYMMSTILLSFVAALGLGVFLTDVLFGIDSISNRVPLYSFVFLVALGIDYNIIMISRFMEERKKHPVKKAIEIAVSRTGGVISSAGIILAATFAVLMTQPVEVLFVFGFIVAVGILMDTFLIRGVLLPALLVLFEKERVQESANKGQG